MDYGIGSDRAEKDYMGLSINRRITAQFTLVVLILAVLGVASYYNTTNLTSTAQWVEQTHEMLDRLNALLHQITEAESAARGYFIAEKEEFLEPYGALLSAIRRNLEEIRRRASDNPAQAERFDRLEPRVGVKLSLLQELIDLRRQRGLEPATRSALVDRGKEMMGEIRALISEMESDERALLVRRYEEAQDGARKTLAMNLVGSLLSFALLALAFYLLNLEIERRRRAESALQETTSLQRAILDAANYTIISTAPDGTIKSFNAAAERMLGYPARDIIGKTTPDLFHDSKEIAQRAEELSDELGVRVEPGIEVFIARARLGGPDENEWTYIRKDGSKFSVLLSITTLLDKEGEVKGFLGIGSDITERRQAERELQESRSRLQSILDNTTSVVYMKDLAGRYMLTNRQYENIFHVRKSEIEGKTDYDLFAKEAAASFRENDLKALEIGSAYELEEAVPQDDGLHTYLSIKFPLFNSRGRPYAICGVSTDITERKMAEERQSELFKELESANRELSDFAYVVSHDLKAPLRAIGSLASWISSDYADKFDEDGREQMSLLRGRVKRMHDLIDGILQYSRVGRTKEQKVEVDLDSLVREVIGLLSPPPHVRVTVEGTLPTVMCERTRMEQVFQNLLSNALKFMDKPEGDVRISCADRGDDWVFSVSDNGPGIEEKHFAKIFQIFQTLAPRDEVESTGIGLSVVKKTIEMYGGTVWVESTVGGGSTFFFSLPKRTTQTLARASGPLAE